MSRMLELVRRIVHLPAMALSILLAGCTLTAFPNQSSLPPPGLLSPLPADIDMGDIVPGGSAEATFTLFNSGAKGVDIARIETSCECLAVKLARRRCGPGETVRVGLRFDGRDDPAYCGTLAIDVEGRTLAGKTLFKVAVNVRVIGGK